jgi:hypothetical protein
MPTRSCVVTPEPHRVPKLPGCGSGTDKLLRARVSGPELRLQRRTRHGFSGGAHSTKSRSFVAVKSGLLNLPELGSRSHLDVREQIEVFVVFVLATLAETDGLLRFDEFDPLDPFDHFCCQVGFQPAAAVEPRRPL